MQNVWGVFIFEESCYVEKSFAQVKGVVAQAKRVEKRREDSQTKISLSEMDLDGQTAGWTFPLIDQECILKAVR